MQYHWYDFVGNLGVVLILVTYTLLQLEKLKSSQLSYSALNGVGAGLILVSLSMEFNLSAFLIEFFWLLISIMGIVRHRRSRRVVV